MKDYYKRINSILILIMIVISGLAACSPAAKSQDFDITSITSYRDIPGVTEEEIIAIEKIRETVDEFSFGSLYSTEAFRQPDGSLSGFAVNLTELLTGLFDIPFTPALYDWTTLKTGIDEKTIDFSSDFIPTAERLLIYHMTHPVAQRSLGVFTYGNEIRLDSELSLNGLRIGFLDGSVHALVVSETYPALDFEVVNIQHTDDGISKLKAGEIDAYIMESVDKIIFAEESDIRFWEVVPLVYNPVSLTTANPYYKPIIDVMNKYIAAGGIYQLHELYTAGDMEYSKHVLNLSYTDEQKAYLAYLYENDLKIPIALEHDTYPICFFNYTDQEFQGIVPDMLKQITQLTGIEFDIVTESDTPFYRMLEMLHTGEAYMVSELLFTEERANRFLWSEPYYTSRFALISSIELPFLEMYQVASYRVGVSKGTAYNDMYNLWFRGNSNLVYFNSHIEAIEAMENGEVDLIMASEKTLIMLSNLLELHGYKVNILFNMAEESYFGFGLEHEVLRSIIANAQQYVDVERSSVYWTSRFFDYNRILEQQRYMDILSGFIIILILVLIVLVLLIVNVARKRAIIFKQSQRLQAALDEAKKADRAKTNFLATISHEMRTPMNAVIGIAQIELQKAKLPAEYEEAFEKIHHSGTSLLGIIDDILDLTKIETGKIELRPMQYSLPSLINDAVQLNIIRIGDKPIELKLEINESLPSLLIGDVLRLKQILNNLLSNAIKYTEKGYVKLEVGTSTEVSGKTILKFIVEDSGQGFKSKDKERLFTEYLRFNAEANSSIEGTGIGLAITKKLVELMDGEITIESEYGKGSTFTITVVQESLPCEIIGKETADNLRSFNFIKSKDSRQQIKRYLMPYGKVLVVDDVETNLYVAEGLLAPYKLKIETVNSGLKAIKKIEDGASYDIIFMDHMMPIMDGIEATAKIRESGYTGTIIALTANALIGNAEMFKDNGFDGFIAKPIDILHLDAVLNEFVRDKHPDAAEAVFEIAESEIDNEDVSLDVGVDPKLLAIFRQDAKNAIITIKDSLANNNMKLFTTTVHAMKSALANIGEKTLSNTASELEDAGRKKDLAFVTKGIGDFIASLEDLIKGFEPDDVVFDDSDIVEDKEFLVEFLDKIKEACAEYDVAAAYEVLDVLREKTWKNETVARFDEIYRMLYFDSDFEGVCEYIDECR